MLIRQTVVEMLDTRHKRAIKGAALVPDGAEDTGAMHDAWCRGKDGVPK